jgi:hypothetical protein
MERFDEDEIFYLEEGNERRTMHKYITPEEFQFIYDCIQGKFKQIVPQNSKSKLENKIIAYLEPNIELKYIDFKKFTNCEEAKEQLEPSKKSEKSNRNVIELNARFYCSSLPKFMNIYISQIFTNLLSIENADDNLFKDFVSLHIDIFTNFFINRERKISKDEPYYYLYRNLVNMYDDSFYKDGKKSLMDLEVGKEKNLIYNTFVEYQTNFSSKELKKSTSYFYDCTRKATTIEKLLCGLTHKRETNEAFKFEKRFEHSTQFRPYKGGVKFNLKGLGDLIVTVQKVKKDKTIEVVELQQEIRKLYIKAFNIILNDNDVFDLFNKCFNNPDENNSKDCDINKKVIEKIKELFSSRLQITFINDLNKNIKGDVATIKPIYECGTTNKVIGLDKKIELKYFDYYDIMNKKDRTVHLTRILEPNPDDIKSNIETTLYEIETKEFNAIFALVLNTLIQVLLKSLESFSKLIINKTSRTEGLIIDGPKFIKNNNDWSFELDKGDKFQRGIGPSINLILPANPDVWDFDYDYDTRLFCLKKS